MDSEEKREKSLRLKELLDSLDQTITSMKQQNFPREEIEEYVKSRWKIWDQLDKAKKS